MAEREKILEVRDLNISFKINYFHPDEKIFRRTQLSPFLYLWAFMLFIIILRINTFLLKINTNWLNRLKNSFLQ